MKRTALALALLLPVLTVRAQDDRQLTVDGDFLARGELRYGGLADGAETEARNRAAFLLGRSRVGAGYRQAGFSARLTAQHSGTWGSEGSIGVYEAWVKFDTKPGFFFQVGRQNLIYDDQRIFGSDDWSMTGMSHDILKVGYEGHGHKVHLFGAYNQNPENIAGGSYYQDGYQPYKTLQALWYHYDIPSWHVGASAVFMNVGMQDENQGKEKDETHFQQLAGAFLSFKPDPWSVEAAYYRQMGYSEEGIPIEAWMASLRASVQLSSAWNLYAGYDHLSGDDSFATPASGETGLIRHEKIKGFNSIFGSHHKFYGAMDFFYVTTYVNGFTPGLQNAYAGARWNPLPAISVDASYHYLAVTTPVREMGKTLGHEVEFSASWSFLKEARISLGYSFMQGTETMEVLKRSTGNNRLHWGWLMLSATPALGRLSLKEKQ